MNLTETLVIKALQKDIARFSQENPGVYFVRGLTDDELQKGIKANELASTVVPGQSQAISILPARVGPHWWKYYECHWIQKTARNIFRKGITIGRTQNNDVVILQASVSKFHAWIETNAGYHLFDAASSSGTYANNKPISSSGEKGYSLRSGDILKIGDVSLTFFDAESLYRWIVSENSKALAS
jgi:hypothetical protein